MNEIDFEIKNPIIVRIFFYFFGVLTTITGIILTIYLILASEKSRSLWIIAIMVYFFMALSILGVYVSIREKFYLKAGVFAYIKAFKKSQFAKVEEIGYITLTYKKFFHMAQVQFYDKNNNILIDFVDDGTAFSGGKFKKAINELKIEFREVY